MTILDIALLSTAALLVLAAIWLWNVGTTTASSLTVKTAVVPRPDISSSYAGKRRVPGSLELRYLPLLGYAAGAVLGLLIFALFFALPSNPILGHSLVPFLLVAVTVIILVIYLSQRRTGSRVRNEREIDRLRMPPSEMVSIPVPEDREEAQPEKARTAADRIQFSGLANLPSRVYVGRSEGISVLLEREGPTARLGGKTLSVRESDDGMLVTLVVPSEPGTHAFLEIELLGSGAQIKGRNPQRQPLETYFLQYHWNCLFLTPGRQTLTMVFRVVEDDNRIELGALHHRIKVGQLDHISPEQLAILSFVSGLASMVSFGIYIVQLLL